MFVRESWLWCVRRSLAGLNLDSFGDTLQNSKQLYFNRILQSTKYFVMMECEHIGETSICSQERIYIFKFPVFFELSCRDLTTFTTLLTTLII
jgi:hypothetical protein